MHYARAYSACMRMKPMGMPPCYYARVYAEAVFLRRASDLTRGKSETSTRVSSFESIYVSGV